MAIKGTITRIHGSKPWLARYEDGSMIGTFADLREAQIPIENANGGRRLNWVLDESMSALNGAFYVGNTT